MADKKEEHTAHSVASKIAKALLKVKPTAKRSNLAKNNNQKR
jgi:hypothetical protein